MNWLFDGITEWIRQFLIDGIMAKFADIFGYVNDQVADIAVTWSDPGGLERRGFCYG